MAGMYLDNEKFLDTDKEENNGIQQRQIQTPKSGDKRRHRRHVPVQRRRQRHEPA